MGLTAIRGQAWWVDMQLMPVAQRNGKPGGGLDLHAFDGLSVEETEAGLVAGEQHLALVFG